MLFEFDPNDKRCRYLRINGARCRQAALNGEELCFEHKLRKLRTRPGRKPSLPSTFNQIPLVAFAWVEDHASILSNLNHVIEAFAHGIIDHRQAVAYGCLLRTGLKTLKQMHDLEDLAVTEKEKPAQRFELDEYELPLAIDDPIDQPIDDSQPSSAAPPQPASDTQGPSADPGHGLVASPACPVPADTGREDTAKEELPPPEEPADRLPAAEESPVPTLCVPSAANDSNAATAPGDPQPEPAAPGSGDDEPPLQPLPDADFLALNPHWEETMRRYYRNDPVLLASIGLRPLPARSRKAASSADPGTVSLTAAADPLPALPAPNPYPVTHDPVHTYTHSTIFFGQPGPARSTIENRERAPISPVPEGSL